MANIKYPWDMLRVPGDYFLISKRIESLRHMKSIVASRNYRYKDLPGFHVQYSCEESEKYVYVILVEVGGFDTSHGIAITERARLGE
ncbi:MAG TPA: hypothetical protein VF944_04420 [Candidatus Bathyarchaeia archaeon]